MEDTGSGSRGSSRRALGQALLDDQFHSSSTSDEQVSPRSNEAPGQHQGHYRKSSHVGSVDEDGYATGTARFGGQNQLIPSDTQRSTSVRRILTEMAVGDTVGRDGGQWKLTRAVIHLEDAWKGRVSPCPPDLHEKRVRRLFKMRYHLRRLEILVIHVLMALSLVETPAWCVGNGKCLWSCFPDFSRNWHLGTTPSSILEVSMLTCLMAIAAVDVYLYGRAYWEKGNGKGVTQAIWSKHGVLAVYAVILILGYTTVTSIHLVVGYCRVLLYLAVHRRTMLVVAQLRHILGAVAEIWILIFINILLFAWIGMVLFAGSDEGDVYFPNLLETGWRLFVLFTTTNFPDIMMTALANVRASFIYFAAFVTLNVFFLAPLSLAFIFNVFRGGQKGIPRLEEEIRLESTAAAFKLLDEGGTGNVKMATVGALLLEVHSLRGLAPRELARLQDLIEEAGVRTPEQPSLRLADFQDAVRVMDRALQHAEWITEAQWYCPGLYQSPRFRQFTRVVKHQRVTLWPGLAGVPKWTVLLMDLMEAILLLISFIALFAASAGAAGQPLLHYDYVQLGVVTGFVVTTAVTALVRGWYNCVQRPPFVFNLTVTFASVLVITFAYTSAGEKWGWHVMRALRVLHLGLVVAFMPRLGFLVRTLLIMTKRASTPASVLLAWSFFMAVLGVQLFGGLVCLPALATLDENCDGYIVVDNSYNRSGLGLLNFNDVPTAFVTLFVLFVVNDWYVIVDEFVAVSGSGWARAFFIVNYIIGVAVILNLVVTVVINSFWDEYKTTVKPALALQHLHDAAAQSAHPAAAGDGGISARSGGSVSTVNGGGDGGGGGGVDGTGAVDGGTPSNPVYATCYRTPDAARVRLASAGAGVEAPAAQAPSDDGSWAWGRTVDNHGLGGRGARVASEDAGFAGGVVGHQPGGGAVRGIAVTGGDQEGMDAERRMTTRASERRLAVSGIT